MKFPAGNLLPAPMSRTRGMTTATVLGPELSERCRRAAPEANAVARFPLSLCNLLLPKPMDVFVDLALNCLHGALRDLTREHTLGHGRKLAGDVANIVNDVTCVTG